MDVTIDSEWLRRFLKRHPDYSVRKKLPIKMSDANKFTQEKAAAFVADLEDLDKRGCLKDPRRIGNLDESGFKLG